MIKMDLSLLNDEAMDDSFLVIRAEAMDDEVTQIFKKWKLNNPMPKKDVENLHTHVTSTTAVPPSPLSSNETQFDSRTFTRPPKRRTFNIYSPSESSLATESDTQSMESGIASINLRVGGAFTPMQRSWLNDVSPPSSICTSMDFQNNDTMLNSLVTSSDFTNVSFLLNGSLHENEMPKRAANINNTVILSNGKSNNNNQIVTLNPNATRNLMDFTYDIHDKTLTNEQIGNGNTFITDSEPPIKEFGIENADIQLNTSTEDIGKNLTFNKYDCNITWDKIQNQSLNMTIVQSTPIHKNEPIPKQTDFDDTLSPISSLHAQIVDDEDDDINDNDELVLRNAKSKRLLHLMDDYRNSIEDQCEFLLNEETIKLSSRVCGDSFERLDDIKHALITSADVNEREFDEMLDSKFNITKSKEGERLLQSVDNIKQRHSLINMEKQREEKHKRDSENDNRIQYDVMNKSSERLLNRRSRLFDDVNLQLQKQQQIETSNMNGSASSSSSTQVNKTHTLESAVNEAENDDEVVDKNDRDRFKTIKLNRPRLQAMPVIDTDEGADIGSEISPGSNKERRNQINQQKQEEENVDFKKPAPVSRLSKFGFSRPAYRPRNDLNLPLKSNSTDSLDNDSESSISRQPVSNLKSPMGIKSKSIHNLMYNGTQNGIRMSNNLKYSTETKSQSNLKAPRASSLVRQNVDTNFKLPQSNQPRVLAANKKGPGLIRPSSGYYGNAKRLDSDNESYSLSSSSASSRNSVHLSLAPDQQFYQTNSLQSTEDLHHPSMNQQQKTFGAVPKPSGISRPMSGLPRPQIGGIKSGLPRPKR